MEGRHAADGDCPGLLLVERLPLFLERGNRLVEVAGIAREELVAVLELESALERGRIDKATWHGPAAGLQFHTRLMEPIVAGALPVRRSDSPLGYSAFTVAYVHLFRRGDSGGSPGMLLLFERTLPEW